MQIGKYQLVRKLASGGMAEVFLAKAAGPRGFEKTLVLKRILPHLAEDAAFVEMFLGEARLAAQLEHPNIVQIFDFGEAEGSFFLAMEFIDGPNLRKLVKRAAEEALPPAFCAKVVAAAAEGLAYAHEFRDVETGEPLGLIHRDVSPDNILVSRQGAVKVVDFGIAKVAGQGHRTLTGVVKGKVAYMPPEQLQAKAMDRRVDVYALGVVLYELLTGKRPFDATTDVSVMQAILFEAFIPVSQRRPDVPLALQQVLDRALAKDRERRYADCRALQDDLERFVLSTGEPVGAYQIAQRIAQWVPELTSGSLTKVPREAESKAPASEVPVSSMVSPLDSTSPTTPVPQEALAKVAPPSGEVTTPARPIPTRALRSQVGHPPVEQTAPALSLPIAVRVVDAESVAPRPGTERVATPAAPALLDGPRLALHGVSPEAKEVHSAARPVSLPGTGLRVAVRRSTTEGRGTDKDAEIAALAALLPKGVGTSAPVPIVDEDVEDAIHTRSAEYLAPGRAKKWAVPVVGVGGMLLALGVGLVLVGGEEKKAELVDTPQVSEAPVESVPQEEAKVAERVEREVVPEPSPVDAPEDAGVEMKQEGMADAAGPSKDAAVPEEMRAEPVVLSAPPLATPKPKERNAPRKVAVAAKGRLELRVRPYAVVYLNGGMLGETPLNSVEVPAGRHTLRLVNQELGKDVTRAVDVKAGQSTVFKLNLDAE
ncbi:serine/threonine protein kinase [Myxococcus xanthus]|nr:serine/threonine-protein kinase [Myxococcus xanthus]QDE96539.1 serine/threonine protein kinase [Myxococcus xanthus]QDF04029.1 serine/threonine protein kinase [Myxococcus xanthus]